MIGRKLPEVAFKTRVRDASVEGPNPYRWETRTTDDYFKGKRVVLFSLPGAFTPTCSTYQLPDFEQLHGEFTRKMGMLVCKDNLGFDMRSWRYAAIVDDGVVEAWFEEPGHADNCETDPYGESAPQNLLAKLADGADRARAAA
jgi:peroxiredoxin